MAGSVLGYRVYRLRRLIAVSLGLVAFGLLIGVWLMPGPATALQMVFGMGLFSIFAMAHLAMIVIWPNDAGGPLAFGLGTGILLAIALPTGAFQLGMGTEAALLVVLGVMFGPLVWLLGAPWVGRWVLWLIGIALPQTARQSRVFDLPLDLPRAIEMFALDPDKTRVLSVHGPVGWDGCFEETTTRMMADHQTGIIAPQKTVNRFRVLASDETTRSVMVTMPLGAGPAVSIVVHQQFAETTGAGGPHTRLTEHLDIEGAPGLSLVLGWLLDGAADYVTAALDADAGQAPRAMAHLPLDSMTLALTRFLKWGDPPPG